MSEVNQSKPQNSFVVPGWVFVISGAICAMLQLGTVLSTPAGGNPPPSLFALSMSFGCMMMGVGCLYRVRGQKGVLALRLAAILILLVGLFGPVFYSAQTVRWRAVAQKQEADNTRIIAAAARDYAEKNGKYPISLSFMLGHKLIAPENLKSPMGPISSSQKQLPKVTENTWFQHEADVRDASDYAYWANDLPQGAPAETIVVTGKDVIWASALNIGFADGSQRFVKQEEIEAVRKASDAARRGIGLPPIQK
jgi:hypothetical protein